jgi:hypothetical protein
MAIYCRNCGLSSFRISHFRFRAPDLSQLFLLRFPVRCRICHERTFVSLPQYLKLRREHKTRHRKNGIMI